MDSLEEQLRQLTILNSRTKDDEGYVRTGKVAALVENLQQKVSAEQCNVHGKSKVAPTIPPKPFRKSMEMPQVPLSKLVTDTREPLYSQPLHSLELGAIKDTKTVSEFRPGSGSMLFRKQPTYATQSAEKSATLDNPAVLEQQLEALAYHKLQMEKRGLLGLKGHATEQHSTVPSIPKLSSTSLSARNLTSSQNASAYSNLRTCPDNTKPEYMHLSTRSENNASILYSNIQQTVTQKNLKPISSMEPLPGQLSICTSSFIKKDFDDELPPPPSPVSSSYSELRRASDIFNKAVVNPQENNVIHGQLPMPVVSHGNYANHYVQNTTPKYYQGKSCADYYGYGGLSQTSSTYDSIYEPINPRPPNDNTLRTNYNMYANINQSNIPINSTNTENTSMYCSGGIATDESIDPNYSKRDTDTIDDSQSNYHLTPIDSTNEVESYGRCYKCGERVLGENSGCTAMDQIYHISCFTCTECQINLQGKPFYALEGNPFCEYDYLQTLEKCSVCLKPILERILRATGKPYHPQCFTCVVCGNSLDAIPFTVDATNQNYCIADFHKKFAPRCCVCKEPILPEPGQEETVRVVALDRSFHLECYKCEDCGLLLSSEADGRGCYPLDDHVLCKSCNARRVQVLTNRMT
ncbi:lipoma-preferred partner homolog [Drosophila innubila]|uniref:lipoma-preferred partner homolog n=1 Tax=Drosophila innubila TaxID=198719 RepID=UPI00148E7997|nr:lipoma-preferred partner homolog [Drosophila innubila]